MEYERFQEAYECLKRATSGFQELDASRVWDGLVTDSLTFLVVRTMLGMTPPEWAYLASAEGPVQIDQGAARTLDQRARTQRDYIARVAARGDNATVPRIRSLVEVACRYLQMVAPAGAADTVHRFNKFDTADGVHSVQRASDLGVPYAVVLYERYLGRPFASHRDSVSELVGEVMESAVEARLAGAHVSFRKTKRAERLRGFEQAPDFMIPDELAPAVVIEAKITNDDGTARDKVARLLRLVQMSEDRRLRGATAFEVVACIDGRGFGQRREDMRQLLRALHGKVFTIATMDQLIPNTAIRTFATGR
ncbi:MAG: hypothetical protein ACYDAG_04680 [Chloroflexota bacterium]